MSRAPTNRLVISDPGGHTSSITTKTTPAHLFPNGVALTSMSLGLGDSGLARSRGVHRGHGLHHKVAWLNHHTGLLGARHSQKEHPVIVAEVNRRRYFMRL